MRMVEVGAKEKTERVAVATARVRMAPATLAKLRKTKGKAKKGNVLEAARLAAIMATKRTPDIVPLCHPIAITGVDASVEPVTVGVEIRVEVRTVDRTGVEMEALMGASAAALTVYDMLKGEDRGMVIEKVQLEHKSGGRSGTWNR
ncbi:MAG: cyclic pyranopterin monophosphate synthase MoaC [Myxococcaceae bacterium]|nr:cyclic pyranopterin monophosphate synthase MoaC [Myxococcaceae bacterium]